MRKAIPQPRRFLLPICMLAISLLMTACVPSISGWTLLLPDLSWDDCKLAVDPLRSRFIAVSVLSDKAAFYDTFDLSKKKDINLSYDLYPTQVWLSDKLWVFNDDGYLKSFDIESGVWSFHDQLNRFVDVSLAPNGDILYISQSTKVIFINRGDTTISKISVPDDPDGIYRVAQDHQHNLWALSRSGQLYKFEDGTWAKDGVAGPALDKQNNAYRLYIDENDDVWVVRRDGVYLYKSSTQQSVLIYNISKSIYIAQILFTDGKTSWIVTRDSITIYDGKSATIQRLPWDVDHIWDAAYDEQSGKFFLSTNIGVFYRQVAKK